MVPLTARRGEQVWSVRSGLEEPQCRPVVQEEQHEHKQTPVRCLVVTNHCLMSSLLPAKGDKERQSYQQAKGVCFQGNIVIDYFTVTSTGIVRASHPAKLGM